MTRRFFLFDTPDRFVAGAIGEPGNRTFFLQAREGARIVSVALEKVQVAALAERLDDLLGELDQRGVEGAAENGMSADAGPLDEPLNEAFRAGTLSLGWDGSVGRVMVEARAQSELGEEEEDDADDESPEGPDVMRVRLLPIEARSFVEHAVRVLGSGRPPCPYCGQPLDPLGHLCPRRNGHLLN